MDNLQKQAKQAADKYAEFYEFEDSNWVGAVRLGYAKGYISGYSSRDAEVEQLREALELIVGFSEDEPGMWLKRIHGIAKESLSPNK